MPIDSRRSGGAATALFIGLAYFVVAAASLRLTGGKPSPVWTADALALVLLLRGVDRVTHRALGLASLAAAALAARLLVHEDALSAVLLASGDVLAVGVSALLATRYGPKSLRTVSDGWSFFFLGGPPAAVIAGLSGGVAVAVAGGPDPIGQGVAIGISRLLGFILLGPIGMTVSWKELARLRAPGRWIEAIAVELTVAVCAIACFSQSQVPLIFAVTPCLIFATYRFRFLGGNVSLLTLAAIAGPLTVSGHGPLAIASGGYVLRLIPLQLFLVTNGLTVGALAAGLGERDRLLATERRHERATMAANFELERTRRIGEIAETIVLSGYFSFERPGGATHWSPGLYTIFGVEPEAPTLTVGQLLDLVAPADRDRLDPIVQTALTSRGDFEFETEIINLKGERRHIRVRGRQIDEGEGRLMVLGVVRDVTAEAAAAEALARSERQYRHLAETAGDLIVQGGPSGKLVYVSSAATEVTGYEPEEVLGQAPLALLIDEDRPAAEAAFRAAARSRSERTWTFRYRARRKDGEVRWLEARPRFMFDADGRVTGHTTVIRDINDRKRLEMELDAARQAAEAAAAVKGDFLANMSHEFRTPLTSIIGFADLLRPHLVGSGEPQRYLDRIANGSQLLLAVVNDVLDFSRLEAGQIEIRPRPNAPATLLGDIIELLRPQAQAKGLRLETRIDDAARGMVLLDGDRVRQVLLNLIGNAVKFTDTGGVEVSLVLEAGRLRVSVADTGPGVPPAQQPVIFQRFTQVDASATRTHGGAGLGLAISKGLVEAMGGQIGVVSAPGEGSVFWFETPAPAASAPAAVGLEALDEDGAAIAGLRVLFADDNANNRELLQALLHALAVQTQGVSSGEAAVETAAIAPFDVILMDLRMPGIGGEEAARRIRYGGGANDRTPLIAFSASADAVAGSASLDPVFDDVLRKPVAIAALVQTLRRWGLGEDAVNEEPAAQASVFSPA